MPDSCQGGGQAREARCSGTGSGGAPVAGPAGGDVPPQAASSLAWTTFTGSPHNPRVSSDAFDPGATMPAEIPPARRAGSKRAAYHLTLTAGEPLRRAVAVSGAPLVLGRDAARDFHLSDPRISRAHCEVQLERSSVLVRDLDSTNGTFIDDERVVGQRLLRVGYELQLGRYRFRLELLRPDEVTRLEQDARDLERARHYVEQLIPAPWTTGPVRTEWCHVPTAVLGGDALGFSELPDGRVAAYVLDVCGHGTGAAMHAATVLNSLRGRTLGGADFGQPAQVLRRLNEAFRMEDHAGMYFSLWYGVLDVATQRLSWASAGHPPALLVTRDDRLRERLALKQPPIGTRETFEFAQADTGLAAGERLYIYSDGVYEVARSDGRDGGLDDFERRVCEPGASRAGEARRLYEAACADAGTTLDDDFSLLVVAPAEAGGP